MWGRFKVSRFFNPLRFAHSHAKRSVRPHERRQVTPTVYRNTELRIALVGRPNVGKSTLFNRLAGALKHQTTEKHTSPAIFVRSVVDSIPGVTRDPREANGALSDLLVTVVDTPGLEHGVGAKTSVVENASVLEHIGSESANSAYPAYRRMYQGMEAGAVKEVSNADLVLFVVDCKSGVTEVDHEIGQWLRTSTSGKDILLVANKCDVADAEENVVDGYSLGFGDPVPVSAEQGLGFGDLYHAIEKLHQERAPLLPPTLEEPQSEQTPEEIEEQKIRSSFDDELVVGYTQKAQEPLTQLLVSIIGRPNVGKSTLLNRLVSEERSLVGPIAGVTRDAVLSQWKVEQQLQRDGDIPVWLVDTAGVRNVMKVERHHLESLSVKASLKALINSHVVLFVIDAQEPMVHQDLKLLDVAVTHGKAVVIVVNKMDKVRSSEVDLADWRLTLRHRVDSKISAISGVETVEISAKDWERDPSHIPRLFNAVQRARRRWEKRVSTSALNRFVRKFNEQMSVGGSVRSERRNRIGVTKFITQKKIRPPMFRLDGSSAVSMNYVRALTNAIRREFGFEGIPIRVKRPSRRKRR